MKKVILAILFLILGTALSADQRDSLFYCDNWRTWILHVPPSLGEEEKVPLLLALHGGGAAQSNIGATTRFNQKADSARFIAVYPEGLESSPGKRFWNAGTCCGDTSFDDVGFIDALLDTLLHRYPCIDTTRVYLMGISNGGMMCYRLAIELGHRIAAIASAGGNCVIDGLPPRSLPICHISSFLDTHVPFFGGQSDGRMFYPNQDSLLASWAVRFGCTGGRTVVHDDTSDYLQYCYADCNDDVRIDVYLTYDGGHTYPAPWNPKSNSINATDIIWDFLSHYRIPSEVAQPTRYDLTFRKDLDPTAVDRNGASLAGTECNNIVVHAGKLWAADSYMNPPVELEAKILVKPAPDSAWMVDHSFGDEYARVGMLKSVSFTTDAHGRPLTQPISVLIAGLGQWRFQQFTDVRIASRNDATGQWTVSVLSYDIERPDSSNDANETRAIFDHVDRITGIHSVFAGTNTGAVFRGAYDASQPGLIAWDTIPDCDNLYGRVQCGAEANGVLYMGIHVKKESPLAERGPFFRRIDGLNPRWELVIIPEWLDPIDTTKTTRVSGMRGLTSIPYPNGSGREFLLCYQSNPPIIERIEPAFGFRVTTEFNVRSYFENEWGGKLGNYVVAAYNDMTPLRHPETGERMLLIGTWLPHPDRETTDVAKSSWYLARSENGAYSYTRIVAADDPLSKRTYGLRGTRAICPSPFPDETGVYYVGGFDQTGGAWGNTIWIYKGIRQNSTAIEVDKETIPTDFVLHQNYPNPFNPSTVISYQISAVSQVTLKVYDVLGREVATLVDEYQMPGKYNSQFSMQNSQLSSGVYFYQLKAGNYIKTKKIMVIK